MKLKNYLVEGILLTLVLVFAGVIVLRSPLRENVTNPADKAAADKAIACTTCATAATPEADKKTACATCGATDKAAADKATACSTCALPDKVIADKTESDKAAADKKSACTACGADKPEPFKDKIFGIEFKDENQANMAYIGGGIVLFLVIGGILMFAMRRPTPPPMYGMGRRHR